MNAFKENVSTISGREIFATRILDAPRKLVWKVWTEPEHILRWWGPTGFTNTINNMEVKPGGEWEFIMHGPDGTDYKNKIVYVEVVKPSRLVYEHVSGPKFRVTVTFGEHDGKTLLTMRMVFDTPEERNRTVEVFNAVEGLNQTLGKLIQYLKDLKVPS